MGQSSWRHSPGVVLSAASGAIARADEHREGRLFHDSGLAVLQPLVPEAHRFAPPLEVRARHPVVGPGVIPGTHDRLHRNLEALQEARQEVAIAVEERADQEHGDADGAGPVLGSIGPPEGAVALMLEVVEEPGAHQEAVFEVGGVGGVVGGAGEAVLVMDLHVVGVHVEAPVDVVHAVPEQVVGGVGGEDRLQGGRLPHRDLEGVEAAPRDAPHPHLAARAGLRGELGDDRGRVVQLQVRVLPRRRFPLGRSGTAHVHLGHDVTPAREVAVEGVVALVERVVLAVGKELEEDGEGLVRTFRHRPEVGGGQAHAVLHGEETAGDLDLVVRGRGRQAGAGRAAARGQEQQGKRGRATPQP